MEGIHAEIWVVSETRIHAEIQANFQIGVEMRGMFSQTCKHFHSPKNDIKSSLGYFHTFGTLSMSLYILHFEFLRETPEKFPCGNIPRDSTGKGGGNIHIENSPSFPPIFYREIMRKFPMDDSLEFPYKSMWKSWGRGWLALWAGPSLLLLVTAHTSLGCFGFGPKGGT